jgi:polyhydroxybutyrate depolymerase
MSLGRLVLPGLLTALTLSACARPTAPLADATRLAANPIQAASPSAPEQTRPASRALPSVPGTLRFGGKERSYRLYVPASVSDTEPTALVVALHGGGGNAANLERKIQLDAIAEQEGFIVVYPNGSGRIGRILLTWNAGNCCGYALDESIDDVAFLRALVGHLANQYPIDSQRVYATGMSNGAMMAYRLACEASDVFAAVAPVAGALNLDGCDPAFPVSVLAIHGTEDQHVRFEGGPPSVSVDPRARVDRSVAEAMRFWADRDGCDPIPQATQVGEVRHETHSGCLPGLSVELLAIEGGGHAWPGAAKFSPRGDAPSQALSASQAIWDFFEAHPRP